MSTPVIAPGSTLGGYRLGDLLGEGGMGAVYRATDEDGGAVVIKLIHRKYVGRPDIAARFAREALITSSLAHPAIVRVLSSDIEGHQPFIAMEFVRGRTLGAVIEEDAPLDIVRTCDLTQQLLRAIAHAHERGIVHRDLKPANVMITIGPDGREHIKILDFGIAGLFDDARQTRLTQTGQVLGTPGYLSPEQAQGQHVDGRADLWAVGVMLYAMLSKRLPFPGKVAADRIVALLTEPPVPIAPFRPELPPTLGTVLDRMLTKDPAGRYQTAEEVSRALAAAVSEQTTGPAAPAVAGPAPAGPPTTSGPSTVGASPAPAARWPRGMPLALLFGASLLGGGLIFGALFLVFSRGPAPAPTADANPSLEPVVPISLSAEPMPVAPAQVPEGAGPLDSASTEEEEGEETLHVSAEQDAPEAGHSVSRMTMRSNFRDRASGDSRGREPCPHGTVFSSYGGWARPTRNSLVQVYVTIKPAFYANRGCLRGVHPGTSSLVLTLDESSYFTRVRFPNPGPLRPENRACLRREILGLGHTPLNGPDEMLLLSINFECSEP